MNPLVSVIIPVYNGAHFLSDALESVFAQDYRPFEVIVADDGSTDDSAAVAESFAGVSCLRLAKGGVSRARNLAVAASQGEWLAFLDADDRWFPEKLSRQVALGEADPEAGLVICHRVCRIEGEVPDWFIDPANGQPAPCFEPSSWLVRRSVFDSVGGFDESRSLGEDTDWLSRAWDIGMKNVTDQTVGVERRIHRANATGQIASHRDTIFEILRQSVQRKRQRSCGPDGA